MKWKSVNDTTVLYNADSGAYYSNREELSVQTHFCERPFSLFRRIKF